MNRMNVRVMVGVEHIILIEGIFLTKMGLGKNLNIIFPGETTNNGGA